MLFIRNYIKMKPNKITKTNLFRTPNKINQ